MMLKVNTNHLKSFVRDQELINLKPAVTFAHQQLHGRTGPGNEILGWLDWPETLDPQELIKIKDIAREIRANSEALVVIGIGGSYLGAKAATDMLGNSFYNQIPGNIQVYFAGHNISSSYHHDLLDLLEHKDIYLNIISKSGTTTEPALAFRVLKELMATKYSNLELQKRIIVTTDPSKGALRKLAREQNYPTLAIPPDVGGRFSVLTPVGLLPMAAAGIDIERVMAGASQAQQDLADPDLSQNPCYQYAALRNILFRKGKTIEMLIAYEPKLQSLTEWWKQLFGESEGKDQKGIFPASAIYSTDLHSMGQYVQDGLRNLFETVIWAENPGQHITIPHDPQDTDGLNYLTSKTLHYVNEQAFKGTLQAHMDGNVPNIIIQLPDKSPYTFGYLVYFFMKACAVSGYILGVNPFDQPGVEAYKKNMFTHLGKP